MAFIRKLSNLAVVASAAVTFSGAYIVYNSRRLPAHASGHRAGVVEELDRLLFEPSSVQWDSNWDMRDTGTKKPRKKDSGIVENDVEVSKEIKPTGIRHLVFIRHGQYYESAKKDEDKRLTELGRYRKNVLIHYNYVFILIFDFCKVSSHASDQITTIDTLISHNCSDQDILKFIPSCVTQSSQKTRHFIQIC